MQWSLLAWLGLGPTLAKHRIVMASTARSKVQMNRPDVPTRWPQTTFRSLRSDAWWTPIHLVRCLFAACSQARAIRAASRTRLDTQPETGRTTPRRWNWPARSGSCSGRCSSRFLAAQGWQLFASSHGQQLRVGRPKTFQEKTHGFQSFVQAKMRTSRINRRWQRLARQHRLHHGKRPNSTFCSVRAAYRRADGRSAPNANE